MEQLQHFLATSGVRQSTLAARLKITRGYMSELVSGRKLPSLPLAFSIERVTAGAVPVAAWDPGPEDSDQDIPAEDAA